MGKTGFSKGGERPWAKTEISKKVKADQITLDRELQVRTKVIPAVEAKYAHEMQAGAKFPPIQLAQIKNQLYLIDGWHRYGAAVIRNGDETVEAEIHKMTPHEARWAAAQANMTQGQGLATKEKRNVLKAYIHTRQHHKRGEERKSYREIGAELGIKLGTLYRWMENDHPKVFAAMKNDYPEAAKDAEPPKPPDFSPEYMRRIRLLLQDIFGQFEKLKHPMDSQDVIEDIERLLEDMRAYQEALPVPDSLEEDGPVDF